MTFIEKYSAFSRKFYLTVLGITIPFYLLLYGASGHRFNPTTEDIFWMTAVVISFVVAIINFMLKEKTGLGFNLIRILFSITLLLTAFGGLQAFISMVQFDYGDDTIIVQILSYLVPLLFTFSSIIILIGLYTKKTKE